jgi:hypothetical protein
MYRAFKVLAASAALLAAACGDSSKISADLQNDLALASAGSDLELASRATDQTRIVGSVERTTPPSRAVTNSARAPRPRRSPTPQVAVDVQEESEIVEEPEVAATYEPMPAPMEEDEPVVVAASTRPRAIEPSSGGAGPAPRGTDWGTIIGIAGTVVIRGGDVGEDRCIPPGAGRGRTIPISIDRRYPPIGRGTGRVTNGGRMGGGGSVGGGRIGGGSVRQAPRAAPTMPRDMGGSRPVQTASSRPSPSGSNGVFTPIQDRGSVGDVQ